MKRLVAHHFHKDRVHHTALFLFFAALILLGLDFLMAQTAYAPTLSHTLIFRSPNTALDTSSPVDAIEYPYIEVTDSCGPYYDQAPCVNMRSGPGIDYPTVMKLRNGIVLKIEKTVVDDQGRGWYKLIPDTETLHYPERVTSDWYVAADLVQLIYDSGDHILTSSEGDATTTKEIVVSVSTQMLYAYDGNTLFMAQSISTGLTDTPTPLGTYRVFKKTPSRYMQGPIPGLSDQAYDLPGVPWNLYFTKDGAVIHGAYWHNHFGQQWSHGCVNMPLEAAKELYDWADIGTPVIVQG